MHNLESQKMISPISIVDPENTVVQKSKKPIFALLLLAGGLAFCALQLRSNHELLRVAVQQNSILADQQMIDQHRLQSALLVMADLQKNEGLKVELVKIFNSGGRAGAPQPVYLPEPQSK